MHLSERLPSKGGWRSHPFCVKHTWRGIRDDGTTPGSADMTTFCWQCVHWRLPCRLHHSQHNKVMYLVGRANMQAVSPTSLTSGPKVWTNVLPSSPRNCAAKGYRNIALARFLISAATTRRCKAFHVSSSIARTTSYGVALSAVSISALSYGHLIYAACHTAF